MRLNLRYWVRHSSLKMRTSDARLIRDFFGTRLGGCIISTRFAVFF
jgi:hypothetical protein